MTRSLSKEAAAARVAANWERFKHTFVSKTDQEVRTLADQCFATADDIHKNCPIPFFAGYEYRGSQVIVGYGELDALKLAFAAEEELLKRGSKL